MTEIKQRGSGEWDMTVQWLDVDQLVPNAENPNVQDDATFNALVESIENDGWTAPMQAVSIGALDGREMYEIVAGEHRWRAAKVLQCKVPVIALPKDDFDEDRRQWALVKDNILKGALNPEKFSKLYDRMAKKYDPEVLKTLMGFTTSDAFQKVYRQAKENLPPELQKALEEAKDEIKTIDDLSRVLNRLFQAHGETLPSNFMVFSYGSKEVLWVRADKELWSIITKLGEHTDKAGLDYTAVLTEALRDYRPAAEIPGAALAPEFTEVTV
jgi:hypothetical protein